MGGIKGYVRLHVQARATGAAPCGVETYVVVGGDGLGRGAGGCSCCSNV